jgi:hypothetical protein
VDSLIAERGMLPHDVQAGFAREFAYQAQALEAGYSRAGTIVRLRELVDAHLAHAAELCRAYQDAADRVVRKEIELARSGQVPAQMRAALASARAELLGQAIAARVAADAALGASTALAAYTREGLADLPVSEAAPRPLAEGRSRARPASHFSQN